MRPSNRSRSSRNSTGRISQHVAWESKAPRQRWRHPTCDGQLERCPHWLHSAPVSCEELRTPRPSLCHSSSVESHSLRALWSPAHHPGASLTVGHVRRTACRSCPGAPGVVHQDWSPRFTTTQIVAPLGRVTLGLFIMSAPFHCISRFRSSISIHC